MGEPDAVLSEGGAATAQDTAVVPVSVPPHPVIAARYRRSHRDGERWLRTVAVTGGTIILFATISGQAVKNGDTAAWLSMMFNGVMALAAVGAYLTARKWVPQLTTQEGYKVAIGLVNEEYIHLGIQNTLLSAAGQIMSSYNACLHDHSHISSEEYARRIALFSGAIFQEKARKDRIDQAEFRLRTYGLREDPVYAAALTSMKSRFTDSIDAARTLEAMLQADLEFSKKFENMNGLSAHFIQDMASLLEGREGMKVPTLKAMKHLERVWNEMVALQGSVFNAHAPIGELYTVRK